MSCISSGERSSLDIVDVAFALTTFQVKSGTFNLRFEKQLELVKNQSV
jgi:hypothetical protein